MPRPWYESVTVWFNGLGLIVALVGLILEAVTRQALPLTPDVKWVVVVGAGVNLWLRLRYRQNN